MLIACPECGHQVSDAAPTCPNCGHPLKAPAPPPSPSLSVAATATENTRKSPVLLIIAAISLALSLFTPMLLLFFPIMVTLGCATASLIRRESGRPFAIVVLVLGVGLFVLAQIGKSSSFPGGTSSTFGEGSNLDAAQIVDWNWHKDPDFGTRGTIKWNILVRNVSARPLSSVKVTLTTFDGQGKLIASDFTYVNAIPPGDTRSEDSFADYYGNEARAEARITDVRYAD
jgi:hypothetical protein